MDIINLKLKLRPDEEHQYNSPWNIAADFDIDMSLSAKQIAVMLDEYEADHQTLWRLRRRFISILLDIHILFLQFVK